MTQANTSPISDEEELTPERKALLINLDQKIFGTFAEIGAGQEVGRLFFRVGGAAGTIAKTMSAYDMTFSDEIYGKATRYVSRERLDAMLRHEFSLLIERLSAKRGAESTFFVFADTVSARNFKGTNECHGWIGVQFQAAPQQQPNTIVMHVRMTDKENLQQQEALGIVGVNLLYSAFYLHHDIDAFIAALLDGLTIDRIEVDMLEFAGPAFKDVDNRLVSLKLVRKHLADAVILPPDGRVLQPSEVLHGRAVVVERGRYQPVTHVHVDMLEQAKAYFAKNIKTEKDPIVLCELSLHSLGAQEQLRDEQLLNHADMLLALGYTVLVSSNAEFHRLISFFRRYTREKVVVVAGVDVIAKLFVERFYEDLDGGMLEGMGRLFRKNVKLLLYPMTKDKFLSILGRTGTETLPPNPELLPELVTAKEMQLKPLNRLLLTYLQESGAVDEVDCSKPEFLSIDSTEVLEQFRSGNSAWERAVPAAAAAVIKTRQIAV